MAERRTAVVPRHAAPAGPAATRLHPGLEVLRELGLAVVALGCYLGVRRYTLGSTGAAISHAHDVRALERLVGLDWEHTVQDATTSVPGLSTVVTQFYIWGYFPTVICLVVWLHARHREPYRALRNALLASGVVGLVVYASYPTAPPWIDDAGFTDTVAEGSFAGVARPAGITNHLGALPSFHVGWVVLVSLVLLQVARSRVGRLLCLLYPACMAYAVVATGNHWVLDIPAGVLLATIGLLAARWASRPTPPSGRHD